jgi:hypothetical protein
MRSTTRRERERQIQRQIKETESDSDREREKERQSRGGALSRGPTQVKELAPRDAFSREQLESAKLLILEETMDDDEHNPDKVDFATFEQLWDRAEEELRPAGAALQLEYEGLRAKIFEGAKRSAKVVQHAEKLCKGLESRGKTLLEGIREVRLEQFSAVWKGV